MDSVDPHTFAALHRGKGIQGLIQIDTGKPNGDMVIPNRTTWRLVELSGYPVKEYKSILHADLVIPLLGDAMLQDVAEFLAGGKVP